MRQTAILLYAQYVIVYTHANGQMEAPGARKRRPGGTQRLQQGITSPKPELIEVK